MAGRMPWDITAAGADGEKAAPAARPRPGRHLIAVMLLTAALDGVTCIRLAATVVVYGGTHPARSERPSPFIEELPKARGPLDRRLDVDDAVGGVGYAASKNRRPRR